MVPLPIDRDLPRIVEALQSSKNLVVVAPPGAGKTTRVPPAIISAEILSAAHPHLVMLQPRRVAARAAASRIAQEQRWEIGREVGYHVRFDRRIGRSTRIRVLTEGILNRQLQSDPFCTGIGAVLLDEFHERSIHSDLAVALLREVQQTVRPDLLLLIMSATLEAEPASKFLGGCPIVQVDGRTHPVQIGYSPRNESDIADRVAAAATDAIERPASLGFAADDGGDVLAFLPGAGEIARTLQRLSPLADRHDLQLLPLHAACRRRSNRRR